MQVRTFIFLALPLLMLLLIMPNDYAGLTVTNDLTAWFKADSLTNLSDASPVTTWTDSSGNGMDISQGDAGFKPIFDSNAINNLPVVGFDGVDDNLLRSDVFASELFSSNAGSFFFVLRNDNTGTNEETFASWGDGFNDRVGMHTESSNKIEFIHASNFLTATQPIDWTNRFHIVEFFREDNQAAIFIDSSNLASTATFTDSLDNMAGSNEFYVGSAGSGFQFEGSIAEILIYDVGLSPHERNTVFNYLNSKYALSFENQPGFVPEPSEWVFLIALGISLGFMRQSDS